MTRTSGDTPRFKIRLIPSKHQDQCCYELTLQNQLTSNRFFQHNLQRRTKESPLYNTNRPGGCPTYVHITISFNIQNRNPKLQTPYIECSSPKLPLHYGSGPDFSRKLYIAFISGLVIRRGTTANGLTYSSLPCLMS